MYFFFFFFFNDTATTEIYTLSLHDALPIFFSSKSLPNSSIANFRSAAAATRTRCAPACKRLMEQGSAPRATHKVSAAHGLRFPWPITSHQSRAAVVRSHAQNHHLRGFDERRSAVARLQAQLFCGIGGDEGSNVLFADGQRHLGEQPAELQSNHAANQLIASANSTEIRSPRGRVAPLEFHRNQAVDFALRNTVVPAGRLH